MIGSAWIIVSVVVRVGVVVAFTLENVFEVDALAIDPVSRVGDDGGIHCLMISFARNTVLDGCTEVDVSVLITVEPAPIEDDVVDNDDPAVFVSETLLFLVTVVIVFWVAITPFGRVT